MKVNIFNESACCISSQIKDKIGILARYTIKKENTTFNDLNIIITDDNYIKKLNNKFLKKNKPTNVLAFPMQEVSEIYISYDRVSCTKDLFYYVVHGLLHIIGYEHNNTTEAKAMEDKCRQYLKHVTEKDQ